MSFGKILLVICLIGLAIRFRPKAENSKQLVSSKADENGFVVLSPPDQAVKNKVLILAPANCSREAGRKADALEQTLTQSGIPYIRTDQASFGAPNPAEDSVRNQVMNGRIPIVFVGNHAKNFPEGTEIISEYHTSRSR